MVSAGDFKNGVTFEMDGGIFVILEFQHVKPGKGAAFVRTKYKNLKTGAVLDKSFRPTEKFENAIIERQEMQYLYSDGDLFYFMDNTTFEQVGITEEQLDGALKFVKENENVKTLSHAGIIFGIEPPITVVLEVTETEPGVAGNTAQGATKPAIVETGAQVQVPLFVNIGDKLNIDTRTGVYQSRAK